MRQKRFLIDHIVKIALKTSSLSLKLVKTHAIVIVQRAWYWIALCDDCSKSNFFKVQPAVTEVCLCDSIVFVVSVDCFEVFRDIFKISLIVFNKTF